MHDVVIYTRPNCYFCDATKNYLQQKGIDYTSVMIGEDISREDFLEKYPQARTAPWIVIDEEAIGGWDNLQHYKFQYEKVM